MQDVADTLKILLNNKIIFYVLLIVVFSHIVFYKHITIMYSFNLSDRNSLDRLPSGRGIRLHELLNT